MKCGVDFGTTTTTVAVADRGNYPVVSFEDGADTRDYVPSVVAFDDGKLVFGFEADRAARAGAPHIRSFKRFLADPDVTASTSIRLGYRDVELMDVLTRFLAHVADCVRTGSSVSRVRKSEPLEVAVGVPAHAWSGQRFLTLEAFKNAGWDVTTMLNEPSAAGFEYTHRHAGTLNSKRTSVLVYDLGGGTFDASVVEAAGRRLTFSDDVGMPVLATPGSLAQVLATCIENSLRYGGGTTSVSVRSATGGHGVFIDVADQGEGIDDDLAPYVFERSVSGHGSTGVGLALAKSLVEADGGRIELRQRRPAVFTVLLNAVPRSLDPDQVLPQGAVVSVGRRRRF